MRSYRTGIDVPPSSGGSTRSATGGGGAATAAAAARAAATAAAPHQGSLRRYDRTAEPEPASVGDDFESEILYVIEIVASAGRGGVDDDDDDDEQQDQEERRRRQHQKSDGACCHQLCYTRKDFEFAQRLFAILDSESRGLVERRVIEEFVTLRCPVFWRRDDDLKRLQQRSSHGHLRDFLGDDGNAATGEESGKGGSPTFNEIWDSVVSCSKTGPAPDGGGSASGADDGLALIGVEGWMVFCRFIALAQYLEAKRRFSARHLQQTMRHRNAPRGSELVMVDVPPPSPPASLSPQQLASYEQQCKSPLPLPELDLDHSLLAAHDAARRGGGACGRGHHRRWPACSNPHGSVKISLFGPTTTSFSAAGLLNNSGSSSNFNNMEFAVTYVRPTSSPCDCSAELDEVVVRRSMGDMKWLNETFASHKVLGGTLCGRILPPFPGSSSSSPSFKNEDSVTTTIRSTGGAITAAAANSVGRVKNLAVSFLGNYLNTSNSSSAATTVSTDDPSVNPVTVSAAVKKATSPKKPIISGGRIYPEISPAFRARQLERYLNYLLEHPALSTSFPLNTILKASQSGLEAAKESLEEIKRTRKELNDQTPQLDDGKISIPFWPTSTSGDSSHSPNLAWVRTAAQAAMALKVHGMLETTGLNSASARLQHASLPSFGSSNRNPSWDDDDGNQQRAAPESVLFEGTADENAGANHFEEGVVCVHSELDDSAERVVGEDGYDLLPLPVPAPERRILSAGSGAASSSNIAREARFHYGTPPVQSPYEIDHEERPCNAFLGDIAVDENIDKLREVIGSVDNTLSRCLASLGGIVKAQRKRQALHLEIVKGLDSWGGMRGKFVSQRSLLKGVAGIEQSRDIYDEGDVAMMDDIAWQASLASSAVAAAEDVRSAVRVSRTAANAKAAASSAAFAAQTACDTGTFSTIDEARAAQTRASIAQSHAIHAAVVEHEAKSVKRRATLALAHDVKGWNVHRKRELHHACVAYARSQHEATRRAVDAWSSLRDGFIGTSIIPSAHERRPGTATVPTSSQWERSREPPAADVNEVTATIYESSASARDTDGQAAIVAVEHNALSAAPPEASSQTTTDEAEQPNKVPDSFESAGLILPFASAAPIAEEEDEDYARSYHNHSDVSASDHNNSVSKDPDPSSSHDEVLSGSMQSLIDGLMSWGGIEAEEDHFALPAGMAASIALEESAKFV